MPSKSPKDKNCVKELEKCKRECDGLKNQVAGLEQRVQIAVQAANIVSDENHRLTELLSRASFLRAPSMGGGKTGKRSGKKYLKHTRKKRGRRRGGSCGCGN